MACPCYDSKLRLMVSLHFWGVWGTSLFPLLPDQLCSGVVVLVMVSSIDQLDQFKNEHYSHTSVPKITLDWLTCR